MTKSNSSATPSMSNLYEHPWYVQLNLQDSTTTSELPSPPKPKSAATGRKCIKCDAALTYDNWLASAQKHGNYICNSCSRREKVDWWNNLSDAEYLFKRAQARSKRNGREFNITIQDVEAVDTGVCPILHMPIKRYLMTAETTTDSKRNIQQPDSKSLDRIDATKGYTPDNIRVISWRGNSLLKDITIDELKLISDYYHHLSNAS